MDGKLECIVLFQNPVFELKGKRFDLTKDKYVLMLATGKTVSRKFRTMIQISCNLH